jgi:hypothetical protein
MINVFWGIESCGSSYTRRFREYIAYIFMVMGIHSCVTVESLLISFPIEECTWCNTPEDIRHCYRRESIPEDSILRPCNDG